MIRSASIVFGLLLPSAIALAQPPGRRADSPAAAPVPETLREQSYDPALVAAGSQAFGSQCGFCHGPDAAGGSGGPDLTRSELVARDFRGDEIGAVVRSGRLQAEVAMPAFPNLAGDQLDAIVAFIHNQKTLAESVEGGRRAVTAEDVQSGDVAAGRRYFDRNCAGCHSADGDLGGIAARFDGLDLLRRMLNPASDRGVSARATPRAFVTTEDGERHTGPLAYQDEFTIALIDPDGRYRSFATRNVEYEIDDPLERHRELLESFTDDDMHDVVTFLHTLR